MNKLFLVASMAVTSNGCVSLSAHKAALAAKDQRLEQVVMDNGTQCNATLQSLQEQCVQALDEVDRGWTQLMCTLMRQHKLTTPKLCEGVPDLPAEKK